MSADDPKVPVSEDLLNSVKEFDHKALKNVDEPERTLSQARDMTLAGIQNRRPDSLKHAETVEKNLLPGAEDIAAEKKQLAAEGKK